MFAIAAYSHVVQRKRSIRDDSLAGVVVQCYAMQCSGLLCIELRRLMPDQYIIIKFQKVLAARSKLAGPLYCTKLFYSDIVFICGRKAHGSLIKLETLFRAIHLVFSHKPMKTEKKNSLLI